MKDPARDAGGALGSYAYSSGNTVAGDRSVGEILKDTVSNVQDIIRSEVQLAKVETKEELRKAGGAGMMFGVAAVFGLYAVGFCLLCAVYALSLVLPAWASALIIGALSVIVAGVAFATGRNRWKAIKGPQKTMFTVKEDVEWMRSQNKS